MSDVAFIELARPARIRIVGAQMDQMIAHNQTKDLLTNIIWSP